MEELKELVTLVAKNRSKNLDILQAESKNKKPKNVFEKAFTGILKGKINTDADASQHLYGEKPGIKYRSFKHRLRNKLLNSFLFLQPGQKGASNYTKAEYECSRYQHCVKMLLLLSAKKTAGSMTIKLMQIAMKYELTEYVMFCSRTLRGIAAYSGDVRAFEKQDTMYKIWERRDRREEQARTYLDRIFLQYSNSTSLKPEIAGLAFSYCKELETYLAEDKTFTLQLYYHRLCGLAHQIAQEYEKSILVWSDLEKFLQKHKTMERKSRYAEAALQKMVNYLHLRNYKAGRLCAEKCMVFFRTNSNNWFVFMEYYFLLAMQSGAYQDAGQIILEVLKNKRLSEMPARSQEKWKIFEAYIIYIWQSEGLPEDELLLKIDFKINRFVNEVIMFSHDKRGFNIAILIVQILFLLKNKNLILLIDKIQSLKIYRSRYLKRDINFRANVFIQMIIEMDKQEYDFETTKTNTAALLGKLQTSSMIYKGNMEGMEIIPFENLWKMILGQLSIINKQ